ncbi:MAG: methionyl-tRNA formyltransferase [Vicinamibacteria bacterium]|nr:methionyl-tRNA formyltransferase [Vicinamibacteria bacterium]
MVRNPSSSAGSKIERIVFFGTDPFAIASFEALVASGYKILALVTEPQRNRGRGPDSIAGAWRLPILEPDDLTGRDVEEKLRTFDPDIQVVVGFVRSLPKALISLAPHGALKVHPSLLPRHRGAFPVPSAILSGDKETGVTSFLLTEKPDAGPILLSKSTPIGTDETAGDLNARLARLAAELLVDTIRGLEEGALQPRSQEESRASDSPEIGTGPAAIDWKQAAETLSRQIRAYHPSPGVTAIYEGQELRLVRAAPAPSGTGVPGTILQTGFDGILVACGGKTRLRITQLQPEGQRPMSPSAFVAKYRVSTGARFE